MRVLLRVAYDGTKYCGWQIQPEVATVEGMLFKALSELFGRPVDIIGASRTDAGVHALGNVAVFDIETRMPADKISYALNTRLPEDVRIQESRQVPGDFHPRHTDCIKTYEYRIWNDTFENPVNRLYSHFVYGSLDIHAMQDACKYIIGEHDFTSFCASGTQVQDKVRNVHSIEIIKEDKMITIRVTGNGFLYNMVRIIAGTLLKVGQGVIKPEELEGIIEGRDRGLAGPTAPAKGLTLKEIKYKEI